MQTIIEAAKLSKLNHVKKILYFTSFCQEKDYISAWNAFYEKMYDARKEIEFLQFMQDRFELEKCAEDIDLEGVYSQVATEKTHEELDDLLVEWRLVLKIFTEEREWNQALGEKLKELGDENPLLSQILAGVLVGIGTSMMSDCIYSGMNPSPVPNQTMGEMTIYVANEDGSYTFVHYVDEDRIVVEKVDADAVRILD